MARIRIYRHEVGGEDFPRLCMRCGQPAEVDVPQTFAWMPGWVHVLILVGLAPWLIVALVTRRTMRVVVPMCLDHAGHWRVRKMYVWLGLLFWVVFGIALIAFGDALPKDAMGPTILVGMLGALIWLISAAVLANGAIKASEIHEKGMQLVNVNKDFANAWNDAAD